MWVRTLHSINQTLHNWLWTVSSERWWGGGWGVWGQKCLKSTHAQTHTDTQRQRHSSSLLCRSLPLCRLTHSFRCFRPWPHFTTGKKKKEKKRGSPWQQLLQLVGCNACDDIIQTSSNNMDQRYLLMRIPSAVNQNLMCPQTKKEKKRRRGNPSQEERSALWNDIQMFTRWITPWGIQCAGC